jgi:uncharacterized protein YkwD
MFKEIINFIISVFNKNEQPLPPFPNPTPDIIVPVPPEPPTPVPPTPPKPNIDPIIEELLKEHNKYRKSYGKPELKINDKLVAAAQKHAQWMYSNNRMSHTGARRSSHADRIKHEGYSARSTAENVAWGQQSVKEVLNSWIHSRGHRNNILSSNTECGFGMAGNYWCSVFATPDNVSV